MLENLPSGRDYWIHESAEHIPGTTRVPFQEIREYFGSKELIGLDLGSGNGRSTAVLQHEVGGRVIAADLSYLGLQDTHIANGKVQAAAESLPFMSDSFDYVALSGLMTNLVDVDPYKAEQLRLQVASEIFRTLRVNGLVVVSDCATTNIHSIPKMNYDGHQLVTGEYGTIAVYEQPSPIPFSEMQNEEILLFARDHEITRLAHHYSTDEIVGIFSQVGFKNISCNIEEGIKPSGRKMDALILSAIK